MRFSAVQLAPAESLHLSLIDGFVPEKESSPSGLVSHIAQAEYGIPFSPQRLLLWDLTLGVMTDLLDMLSPYNASKLWIYPNFTTPDLRLIIYLLTFRLYSNNAGHLSAGTWPVETVADTSPHAVGVSEVEPRTLANNVGISGVGSGKSLQEYYERISVSIALFLAFRVSLGSAALFWAIRAWRLRRQQGRLQ